MKREVIIVGGGVAGIQTALRLADRGIRPTIVEKEPDLGGKLRGWYHLFPSLTPASEVLSELRRRLAARDVEVMTSAEAVSITPGSVTLADGRTWSAARWSFARLPRFLTPAQGGIRLRGL